MNSITNKNRYILGTKVVSLFVVCIYLLVVVVSPFGVSAQESHGYSLIQLKGSGNSGDVYLAYTSGLGKFKRLIHRDAITNGLYSWITEGITEVNQNTLNSFENFEVVTHYPQEQRTDEQGFQIPPELYLIRKDNDALTIKRLAMSFPSVILSEYIPRDGINPAVFEVSKQEIELYSQGDPIYFTGTDSWESNVYRKQDALQEDERGTRIYDTIIPVGEDLCTIEGDEVVAVIGKPGIQYVTITEAQPLHPDLNFEKLRYGGNVTVYIQATSFYNPTPSFTLECRQVHPLNIHTVDTSTFPEPEITFTSPTYTGEQTFEMDLPQGYQYCAMKDDDGNVFDPYNKELDIRDTEQDRWFPINAIIAGGKTYSVSVQKQSGSISPYQGTWTIQCRAPQTVTLQPNVLNRITGVGRKPFQLLWTAGTKRVLCDSLHYFNLEGQRWGTSQVNTNEVALAYVHRYTESEWTTICQTKDMLDATLDLTDYTPFITGPETKCPPNAPNNPNLLCRVIERSDEIGRLRGENCANHLLGLDDIVENILLVPKNLCIQYRVINEKYVNGRYSTSSQAIYIDVLPIRENEEHFDDWQKSKEKTLIHELCHAQQHYYASSTRRWRYLTPEFANITGHEWKLWQENDDGKVYDWYYPNNRQYYGMYGAGHAGFDPVETGAEFCVAFASLNAGRNDIAEKIHSIRIANTDMVHRIETNNKAREWVEGYMLNPNLEPFFAQDFIANLQVSNVQITDMNVERDRQVLNASFTVSWDQSSTLPTKLTEQGWHSEYKFTADYVIEGYGYLNTPGTLLSKNSYRVTELALNNNQNEESFIIIYLTPMLKNSTKEKQNITLTEGNATIEIDFYQLLIDRGLLNEDGSLPDE